ncbi:SDR family NAD(P)-dependent oxidoreductase [Herbiconiux sp. P16]|uniref:SDR family NAD(P)-dependent oxidoreductase n=1 Tax=Herbiconiux wuyangfengii TaxID=3342794 RepID=UPI0035BB3EB9
MTAHLITTPFGATSTADDVIAGVDLSGRRAIVTGASSGIGVETARALAQAGADVTLAVRSVADGERVAAEIVRNPDADTGTRTPALTVAPLDLADRASIAAFVDGWNGPLHILVDNAGVMAIPERRTPEGWEMQFATNHLGHFALTLGLHDALAAGATPERHSRVVVVSSVGHVNGGIRWHDVNFEHDPYDEWQAYSQSKTANVLFAVEAARRWAADGIDVNALNPGRIWSTGLSRHMSNPPAAFEAASSDGVSEKNIPQGAATSVLLAASPLVEGVTGRYFEDAQEAAPFVEGLRRGVADYARDPADAARLWELSQTLLGSTPLPPR